MLVVREKKKVLKQTLIRIEAEEEEEEESPDIGFGFSSRIAKWGFLGFPIVRSNVLITLWVKVSSANLATQAILRAPDTYSGRLASPNTKVNCNSSEALISFRGVAFKN
ncbi:hypothetical protein L1987_16511 [Smallanthus sonchifolius]|uniref:Uncharacterized protein n=1 Tax=Smallanthus sonchifolius TaxID=185202 RepID=A0ACB9JAN8_9ASTR|nr:hypothetical protein L1987_16511 [Smallanthus sonchifolius]